jgi:tetratricopeptide (TPR) repeat protein
MLKFSECVEHYEQLLKSDPKFESFEVKTRDRAKGTVFNELAIAYGENAKNLNDRSGSQTAINYLENKIQILGDKNPPSIYVTLGGFYGLQNKHDKAKDIFNKAIEAPTYGSNLQMDSLKNAQEFSKRPELAESKHFRGSWKVMLFFILAALVGLIMAFSGETSAGIVNLLFWGIVAFMYWKRKSR